MAKEELRHIGGTTVVRFSGPDFKPREIAKALNALDGMMRQAASLEYRGPPGVSRPRIEPVVTRLSAGSSWEVHLVYAMSVATFVVGPVVDWPRLVGRIVRAFKRLGPAYGWDVSTEVNDAGTREVVDANESEDPRLSEQIVKLWRATLDSAESAEIELMDGRVTISVPARRRRRS